MDDCRVNVRYKIDGFQWALPSVDKIEIEGTLVEAVPLSATYIPATQELVSVYGIEAGSALPESASTCVMVDTVLDIEAWTLTIGSHSTVSLDELIGECPTDSQIAAETGECFDPFNIPLERIVKNAPFHYLDSFGVLHYACTIAEADRDGSSIFILDIGAVKPVVRWKKIDDVWESLDALSFEEGREIILCAMQAAEAV